MLSIVITFAVEEMEAPLNMFCIVMTLLVSKVSGWLKLTALLNIDDMPVTARVSTLNGWLKDRALANIWSRLRTFCELVKVTGWLKEIA